LFVSRLSYDTEVKDLEREFGRFGPIERVSNTPCLSGCDADNCQIRIISNPYADPKAPKKKRLKGYAFIVFERESDMKCIIPFMMDRLPVLTTYSCL